MASQEENSGCPKLQETHVQPELISKTSFHLSDTFQGRDENTSLSLSQDLSSRPSALHRTRERLRCDGTPEVQESVITTPTRLQSNSDIDLDGSDTQEEEEMEQTPKLPVLFSLTDRQLVKKFDNICAQIQTVQDDLELYQGRTMKALARTQLATTTETFKKLMNDFDKVHSRLTVTLSKEKQFLKANKQLRARLHRSLDEATDKNNDVMIYRNLKALKAKATTLTSNAPLHVTLMTPKFNEILVDHTALTDLVENSEEQELVDLLATIDPLVMAATLLFNTQTAATVTPTTAPTPPDSRPIVISARPRPAITLPTFDGDIRHWNEFWALFDRIINADDTLEDPEKFCQLENSIKCHKTRQFLRALKEDYGTYQATTVKFRERFENKQNLFRAVMVECPPPRPTIETPENLGLLERQTKALVSTLKRCNGFSGQALICHLMEGAMHNTTFNAWRSASKKLPNPPTVDDLTTFLHDREEALFVMEPPERHTKKERITKVYKSEPADPPSKPKPDRITTCTYCQGSHYILVCEDFKVLSPKKRLDKAKERNLCLNCLSSKHPTASCTNKGRCWTCNEQHHTWLHQEKKPPRTGTIPPVNPVMPVVGQTSPKLNELEVYPTAMAVVQGASTSRRARILFDSGSGSAIITKKFAQQIGAKRICSTPQLFDSATNPFTSNELVEITLHGSHIAKTVIVHARVVNKLPPVPFVPDDCEYWKQSDILSHPPADPMGTNVDRIDVILNGGNIFSCTTELTYRPSGQKLVMTESIFGWTTNGTCYTKLDIPNTEESKCLVVSQSEPPVKDLQFLWQMEKLPTSDSTLSANDQQAVEHFKATHCRLEDGRYSVSLPRLPNAPPLGHSHSMAVKRAISTQRSMEKKELVEEVANAINEYEVMRHSEPVPFNHIVRRTGTTNYLPRHPVFKNSSTSTKIRIVFDGSAKTSTGHSFNDTLLTGPSLYPRLSSILNRFRLYPIALTADISKMYREISLNKEEKDYHRYITLGFNDRVRDMRMCRVTFGIKCSPFLAISVLRQLADDYQLEHPAAAEIIRTAFYVDDCLTGTYTVPEALALRTELNILLDKGKMCLRKWRTNSPTVKKAIPKELLEDDTSLSITPAELCTKTLGIHWNTDSDTFHVTTPAVTPDVLPTKRQLTSVAARIFDILGWMCPATLQLKLMLRHTWLEQTEWDSPIPESLTQPWAQWASHIKALTEHPIRRNYFPTKPINIQLHVFTDASTEAYGAAVYLRATDDINVFHSTLVTASSKVAPKKAISIPRLELQAALHGATLAASVIQDLQLPLNEVYAWSDSSATLGWLNQDPGKLKVFEANRVRKTTDIIPGKQWRYVPTHQNPADFASRGMGPQELVTCTMWWSGPPWLSQPQASWPRHKDIDLSRTLPVLILTTQPPDFVENFSTFDKLHRCVAWIFRFYQRTRHKYSPASEGLILGEFTKAKQALIGLAQRSIYSDVLAHLSKGQPLPIAHPLSKFRLFFNSRGIICVRGRDGKADNVKGLSTLTPTLLPKQHHITLLIVRQAHLLTSHGGPSTMMAYLASKWHIPACRKITNKVSADCAICRRTYAKTLQPPMADLPSSRVTPSPPFATTGIDYAGPFIYISRDEEGEEISHRCYVSLFICFSTKAVHLELVHDQTASEFVAALQRFSDRRNVPSHIYTDNGTNFTAAEHDLQEIREQLCSGATKEMLTHWAAQREVHWHFSPARSPHFGGLWEAAVKRMKLCLRKVVGQHRLTLTELTTVLTAAESSLNSSPLTAITSMTTDAVEPLTPYHFTTGRAPAAIITDHSTDHTINTNKRWNLVQLLRNKLWKRYFTDYVSLLKQQQPHRFRKGNKANLKVGDIVMVKDQVAFQHYWPLARVTETHPGTDGIVRAVTVFMNNAYFRRASKNLVLIIQDQDQAKDQEKTLSSAGESVETSQQQ